MQYSTYGYLFGIIFFALSFVIVHFFSLVRAGGKMVEKVGGS